MCHAAGCDRCRHQLRNARARVRWDESRTRLSDILAAIAAIGYRAYPYDAARSEAPGERSKAALWRLFVAGFGMMQVMMYAVPVYMAADGDMSARHRGDDALGEHGILTLPVVVLFGGAVLPQCLA